MDTIKQKSFSSKNRKFEESSLYDADIKALFNKHFTISDNETVTLPEPESMFKEEPWQRDELQTLKNELNNVKSRLNNFNLQKWRIHTNKMNKARNVFLRLKNNIQPELMTQAWCKFYEIVCNYPLVPLEKIPYESNRRHFVSVHLCEAPGAFVTALNHWLKVNARDVQWDWIGMTLNPYCEGNSYNSMIDDDRLIRHTLKNWHFGRDNTGNLINTTNLDSLVEKSKNLNKYVMLVTADGSIDCINVPEEQEKAVAHLQFCETVACMSLLHIGGTFLLKVFTLFEHHSVCLMYLLSYAFHKVTITKPATSKEGNSEIYVVCIDFKGKDHIAPYLNILRKYYEISPVKTMFKRKDIPNNFMQKIIECSELFKSYQCKAIEDNINTFELKNSNIDICFELKYVKDIVVNKYFKDYNLKQIDAKDEIVGREIIEKSYNYNMCKKKDDNSYNERCKRQYLGLEERLLQISNQMKQIKYPTNKFYVWQLRTLPEALEIRSGKAFNRIHSSRFCETHILKILNDVYNILQDTHVTVCFPPAEIMEKLEQQNNSDCQTLSFKFIDICDSHQIISNISNQLEKLQIGQTLILIGYCLLTQLNVNLLYILGNSFDNIIVEIHDNESYHIKLENYRHDKKVLNYLHEILKASCNTNRDNTRIWSVIPITVLYEWDQFPVIVELNHLFIKIYVCHVLKEIRTITQT